jgi:hypothetical protein
VFGNKILIHINLKFQAVNPSLLSSVQSIYTRHTSDRTVAKDRYLSLTLHAAWQPQRRPSRCSAMTCVAFLVMFHWHILEERNYLAQRSHWFTELGTSSGLSGGPALNTAQLSFLCRSPHFPKRHCLTCSILLVLGSSLPIAEPETQRSLRGLLTLLLRHTSPLVVCLYT